MALPSPIPSTVANITECLQLEGPLNQFLCAQRVAEADPVIRNQSLCTSGAIPFPLTNEGVCAPGFYCPRMDVNNSATWPQVCAPTAECQLARLANTWCEPQGRYEPQICPPGKFCPTYNTTFTCPAGSWCVRGSTAPRPCGVMTICPAGTIVGQYYGGVVLSIGVDLLLILAMLCMRYAYEPRAAKASSLRSRRQMLSTVNGGGPSSVVVPNPLHPIVNANAGVEQLSPPRASAISAVRKGIATDAAAAWAWLRTAITPRVPGITMDGNGMVRTVSTRRLSAVLSQSSGGDDERDVHTHEGLRTASNRIDRVRSMLQPSWSSQLATGMQSARTSAARLGTLVRESSRVALEALAASGKKVSQRQLAEDAAAAVAEHALTAAAVQVLENGFRRCNAGLIMDLTFTSLRLHLPAPIDKTILFDVSGRIAPGRVTAIMGPSGAGKTTFLSVLMGSVQRTSGALYINGAPGEMGTYRSVTGFVAQEDVMLRELTVREVIEHSARVRLPRLGWTLSAVSQHVDAVIQVLGLAGCAHTLTGRISGGQRKRTNIGIELAVAPAAIFLDEPTSGLDATAALEVCAALRGVANLGVTVVAVIHQPRAEIYDSFDDLLLLAPGGHTVYMGPLAAAPAHFASVGVLTSAPKQHSNPADALLDLVAGREPLFVSPDTLLRAGFQVRDAEEQSPASEDGSETPKSEAGLSPRAVLLSPPQSPQLTTLQHGSVQVIRPRLGSVSTATRTNVRSPVLSAVASPAADDNPLQVCLQGAEVATFLVGYWRNVSCTLATATVSCQVRADVMSPAASTVQPVTHGDDTIAVIDTLHAPHPEAGGGESSKLPASSRGIASWCCRRQQCNTSLVGQNSVLAACRLRVIGCSRSTPAVQPPSAMQLRGASVFSQFVLCHSRALMQQYRQASWLALELAVCVLAGVMMGTASTVVDELYSGILRPPYTILSPAPLDGILPSLGFYINMAIGIAGAPAAVRTFGEERPVFLREHAAGHSTTAYYFAKNVAVLYRMALAALHFAGFFCFVAKPTASFEMLLVIALGIMSGVYGMSMLVSMFVARENGPLLAVIASLIASTLCGYGPSLVQGRELGFWLLQDASYSRWANELWMHAETLPYRDTFLVEEAAALVFGYKLNRPVLNIVMMVVIAVGLRILAFAALLLLGATRGRLSDMFAGALRACKRDKRV